MAKVDINTTQETIKVGMNPAMETLREALRIGGLAGRYTLRALRNGRASAPSRVSTLTIGAACKEGVALFFPTPEDVRGLPVLLEFEKAGSRLMMQPIDFHRKLVDALCRVEDDVVVAHGTPAPETPPAPCPPLESGAAKAARIRRERSDTRVAELLRRTQDVLALRALLYSKTTPERRTLSRGEIFGVIRDHTKLVAPTDLGKFFDGLVAAGALSPMTEHRASSAHVRVHTPPTMVVVSKATAPLQAPAVGSSADRVAHLIARRDELRPAHEEFLAIEAELAAVRKLLA